MKYLVKRNWAVDSGGIPVYQEACVYRAGESSTLPGLKRFEGDTRGFLHRDTKEEAEEAMEGVFDRYRKQGISVRESEWTVVGV